MADLHLIYHARVFSRQRSCSIKSEIASLGVAVGEGVQSGGIRSWNATAQNGDSTPLKVTIVGGGFGGLSCAIACKVQGFQVDVYDQAVEFLRIGDSIGFGSNSARLFHRWDVGNELEKISTNMPGIEIYNFDSSEKMLGFDSQNGDAKEKYGYPALIAHRGDFHQILSRYAVDIGVKLHMATTVSRYDNTKPSIILESGEEIESDVVICGDGFKSKGREAVLGYEDRPIHSGYAVYRAYMDGELLKSDALAEKFLDNDAIRLFIAPDMHGFVTTLRNGKEVNAVLTHKDEADIEEGWNKRGDIKDVLKLTHDWDPAFRRVWELMPLENVIDWKLIYRPCLPQWVSKTGLVSLMGDAAHPFLSTSVQGASQAVEDGATIAKCLAKAGKGNVPLALNVFFEIRHNYVADAQSTGIKQRERWHSLHDRDTKSFKDEFDLNAVSLTNFYLWGNDAEKVVDERWDELSAIVKLRATKLTQENGKAS
ncbi:uncharacterized protein A1O5_13381 [Cladophialophora psammophila CBS 110553]|uniref:FAD-binding domain-containing protein n=1 Tax=Cladophialophora psammophila CBS 110553 TaxID=1182543 RepID=W9VCS3_9EURO|nr:uncharacterized protein A1O5_13381 [Cladophialophora psammophila CBS 110553]EXJ53392.1 hypothetical protein A1O5_13381 [Cladophialophora psammophila CBS 110553]